MWGHGCRGLVRGRTGGVVDRETVFEALGNARRRRVLHYLLQRQRPVQLPDLSRQLAAWENGIARDEVSSDQRKRVYTALRQVHLPKLDEMDLVAFDRDSGRIAPTDRTAEIDAYLRVVPEDEITWSAFYTGLGAISAAIVLAAWGGLFPFSEVPGFAWAFAVSAAVCATGVAHQYSDRNHRIGTEGPPPDC